MAKYCNNPGCDAYKQTFEGKHCPYCGELLVEESVPKVSSKKEFGGDGISVSRVMNDSHDTISNNNTTIVLNGKSLEDLTLKERKVSYRKFCTDVIENGIITPAVRKKLDMYALELDLSQEDAREIERFVKKHSSDAGYELNAFDRDNIDIIKANIAANQGNINDMLAKLEAMSSYDNDEVQFYYNMLQCISSPSVIIRKYEDREQDVYWLAFWAYVGFLKNGQKVKAEKVLRELTVWDSQSQDNLHLLQATGALIGDDIDSAGIFLTKAKNISYLLQPMSQTASYIIKCKGQRKLSNSKEINFFLEKLYGLKEDSPVYAQETYAAPVSDALKNRIPQSKPSVAVTATPQSSYPSVQPVSTGSKKTSGKLTGIIAAAVAVVVAVVLFVPKGKKNVTVPVSATATQATQVAAPAETPAATTGKTATSTNAATKTTTTGTASSGTPANKTSATSPTTNTAPASSNSNNASSSTANTTAGNSNTSTNSSTSSASNPASDPIAELKTAADAGDKDAQYNLGMKYYEGNGVTKNMSTAFQYLKPLADAGYTKAYFPVADMYHRGQGVAKDRNAAEMWYKKAAEAGNAKAKNILLNSF